MRNIVRIFSGVLFMVSAVAKLLSVDTFELYIFGLGFFGLGISFVAARVVIAIEFALGAWLVSGIEAKKAVLSAVGLISVFSLFLVYLIVIGSGESCRCFGDWVDMSPIGSLLKNVVLLILLMFALNSKSLSLRYAGVAVSAVFAASALSIFIISPPDNWRYESYVQNGFNISEYRLLAESLPDDVSCVLTSDNEKVVCFFSLECEFCKMAAKKLGVLHKNWEYAADSVICLFPDKAHEVNPEKFFEETGLVPDICCFVPVKEFVKTVSGYFPTIAVIKGDTLINEFGYRDLH